MKQKAKLFPRLMAVFLLIVTLIGMLPTGVLAIGPIVLGEAVDETHNISVDLLVKYSCFLISFLEIILVVFCIMRCTLTLMYEEKENPYLVRKFLITEAIIHFLLAYFVPFLVSFSFRNFGP